MNLTTLPNWPPTRSLQAAGHDVSQGLHDGHITWVLQVMLGTFNSHLKPMIIKPREALLLLVDSYVDCNLGAAFSKSDDRIICVFPAQSHWALLWGQLHVDSIQWLYCDGLPGRVNTAAMRLAARISEELSLNWSIDPGHLFFQQDDHTCGTVALLHVGARLGLSLLAPTPTCTGPELH